MRLLSVFISIVTVVALEERTSPPSGAIIVSKSPCSAQFSTLQAAVDSLSTNSTSPQSIFLYPGTYEEHVIIPSRKAQLTIYGYTTDTSSYSENQVTVSSNEDTEVVGRNDASVTVNNRAVNTKFYNINIANTHEPGSQGIALSAQAGKQGYYGVQITGYQNTLLANDGTQLYAKSLITGHTDFIFGQRAPAWFENCDIGVKDDIPIGIVEAGGPGFITASGRNSSSNTNYYVFNHCHVKTVLARRFESGAYYLGRPGGNYARVVFQHSYLSSEVERAGWRIWNKGDERTDHVEFGEYGNYGNGRYGTRASFSKKLGSPVAMGTILGSDYSSWVDSHYVLPVISEAV